MTARFVRLGEKERLPIQLSIDGHSVSALDGDTLMTAILTTQGHVRLSEFGDGVRAGFCLMAACQDCWVWTGIGDRIRACDTFAEQGMQIFTVEPGHQ